MEQVSGTFETIGEFTRQPDILLADEEHDRLFGISLSNPRPFPPDATVDATLLHHRPGHDQTGGRVVPLEPEVRAILAGLSREDDNPWVISGRLPRSHITDLQKP